MEISQLKFSPFKVNMTWKLLICFSLLIIVNICAGNRGCPIASEIAPCYCQDPDDDPKLFCWLAKEDEREQENILRRVFRKVAKYDFKTVGIKDCTLPYLPHDLFKDITIDTLYLVNMTLTDLFEEAPTSLAEIKVFALWRTKLFRSFVWEHLSVMTKLERLILNEIPVKILKKDISKYVSKSLKEFSLQSSGTKSFKPGVFDDFVNLESFCIHYGDLKELRRDFFPTPFNSIRHIELSGLPLKSIPDGMFADMPNLDYVDLNSNQLTTLDEAVFGQHDKRIKINLEYNPLHCDCRLSYLFTKRNPNYNLIIGKCATPEDLKGFDVIEVDQYLHCP